MISAIIIKGILTPIGMPVNTPNFTKPFSIGFENGYQTMDLLAAVVFGSIIADDIKNKGIINKKEQFKTVAGTGLIAGVGLSALYMEGLLYLGATGSSVFTQEWKSILNNQYNKYFNG